MLYFAYGSNLSTAWLRTRTPSARPLGRALLKGYQFICNKRSSDGSGKANLALQPGGSVWGVVYEIHNDEIAALDRAEGGYARQVVQVVDSEGRLIDAETYISETLTPAPVPFEWYKGLIVSGAREHGLPEEYIAFLEALPSRAEPTIRTGE